MKRTGLVTLASPASTLTSLYALESTTTPFLIGAGGTSLYSVTSGGTVTAIKTGLTSNKRWEFVSAPVVSSQGPLFGMNGTDTPQYWTGTGTTTNWTNASGSVAVPNGTYMVYNQNQVFVSGVSTTPSRLYWSAIADPTNWDPASLTGAGFMDFDPNDGAPITGLGVVGPYILVGKPRKLWVLVNPATATARQISNNVGIIAHRSIAVGPEGTYFLSEDRGVYVTNGTKLTPISDVITPTFNSVQSGLRAQAAGQYFDSHYYLSLPLVSGSTTNDTTLDYDAQLGSWWKHTIPSNQMAIWHSGGTGTQPYLYSAKSTAAIVDQMFVPNVYQDNGMNFQWAWRGPWQSPMFYRHAWYQTPYYRKRLRQVRIDGFGTVDFSMALDFAGDETLVASNVLASSGTGSIFGGSDGTTFGAADGSLFGVPSIQRARFFSLGVANAFSVVFSATSSTADSITSYIMMLVARRDMVVT